MSGCLALRWQSIRAGRKSIALSARHMSVLSMRQRVCIGPLTPSRFKSAFGCRTLTIGMLGWLPMMLMGFRR